MFTLFNRPPIAKKVVLSTLSPLIGEVEALEYFAGLKRAFHEDVPVFTERSYEYDEGVDAGQMMREAPEDIAEIWQSQVSIYSAKKACREGASKEEIRRIMDGT